MDAAKTLHDCMVCMEGMIKTMELHVPAMRAAAGKGFTAATDVADYLAKRGMPFREAHAVVGHLVLEAEKRGVDIAELPLEVFQQASVLFDADIVGALDLDAVVAARTTRGGTAPSAVAEQMQLVEAGIEADSAAVEELSPVVAMGEGAA